MPRFLLLYPPQHSFHHSMRSGFKLIPYLHQNQVNVKTPRYDLVWGGSLISALEAFYFMLTLIQTFSNSA